MKIIVTGSAGNFGKWVVKDLLEHGHSVVGADLRPPAGLPCPSFIVDFKNAGEVYSTLYEEHPDGVINLAAIPRPGITPARHTFMTNFEVAYNVFEAAASLSIRKVVHASTDSSYGFVFAKHSFLPQYLPLDEAHPQLPQDCYGGSKLLNEHTAQIFTRANPEMQITCLRICGLIDPGSMSHFSQRDVTLEQIRGEYRGLFSYVDMRDAAAAFRLATEKSLPGFEVFNIMANDTTTRFQTKELIAQCFPNVEIRKEFEGCEALFSTEKAKRALEWQPNHTWRKNV